MRTLAIGDIHGCLRSLTALVEAAGLTPDDLVITLGDYVDRGPDSAGALDWVMRRAHEGALVALRGNHELMMMRARTDASTFYDWLKWGGDATLSSYSGEATGSLDDVPEEHWVFLEHGCRNFFETPTHFFVHASADPDLDLDRQTETMLFWEKFRSPPPHRSGKIMVCGHTAQLSGRPRDIGHAVCIDTCPYGGGWLTCLDVDTGRYWQANEQGETRESSLGS